MDRAIAIPVSPLHFVVGGIVSELFTTYIHTHTQTDLSKLRPCEGDNSGSNDGNGVCHVRKHSREKEKMFFPTMLSEGFCPRNINTR